MENERQMRQIRSITSGFQTREAQTDSDSPIIEGYFSVFNSDYEMWPGACEQIAQGAFLSSIGVHDIRALTDHNTRLVLGRTGAGTLELREDETGLWGAIKINRNDTDAMNLYSRVQRGDVNQCSFGFDIIDEEYIQNEDGTCLWLIRDVRLYEVSVVTFPAYEATGVSARKKDYEEMQSRRLEKWRREMRERNEKIWH